MLMMQFLINYFSDKLMLERIYIMKKLLIALFVLILSAPTFSYSEPTLGCTQGLICRESSKFDYQVGYSSASRKNNSCFSIDDNCYISKIILDKPYLCFYTLDKTGKIISIYPVGKSICNQEGLTEAEAIAKQFPVNITWQEYSKLKKANKQYNYGSSQDATTTVLETK